MTRARQVFDFYAIFEYIRFGAALMMIYSKIGIMSSAPTSFFGPNERACMTNFVHSIMQLIFSNGVRLSSILSRTIRYKVSYLEIISIERETFSSIVPHLRVSKPFGYLEMLEGDPLQLSCSEPEKKIGICFSVWKYPIAKIYSLYQQRSVILLRV